MPSSEPSTWLLDGNVLVALGIQEHVHHEQALSWFDQQAAPFATCNTTQGTFLRVFMIHAPHPNATIAWNALKHICSHPDHRFWDDSFSYLDIEPKFITGHRQITDAWLAELARRRNGRLATLDAALAKQHQDIATLITG